MIQVHWFTLGYSPVWIWEYHVLVLVLIYPLYLCDFVISFVDSILSCIMIVIHSTCKTDDDTSLLFQFQLYQQRSILCSNCLSACLVR